MMRTLHKLKIEGFKSIAFADVELRDLNVVIGANGSGKSNLVAVFSLLERVLAHQLQSYVAGAPDRLLHHGRKRTPSLRVDLDFADFGYRFQLSAQRDTLVFENEGVRYQGFWHDGSSIARGHVESKLHEATQRDPAGIPPRLLAGMAQLVVHHFNDTSDTAPAKQAGDLADNRFFRADAANLAPYLYLLQEKHPVEFRHVEEHVRLVAPYFDRFVLAPSRLNENKIKLEWRQTGSDAYFDGYSLSDGTLRFICLATLLLQPTPPALILLDEPELGLHPYAIRILAEMLESASRRSQVLLATQSVTLLNQFAPADVLVAENEGGATTFKPLDEIALERWLVDFSLGELWEKNVIGGRP